MKIKWLIFAVLVASFVLLMNSGTVAVSTREVDNVRKKAVLDNSDLKIIDDFLAQAIQELVGTRDLTDIAKIRTVILSRQSTQGQYAQQFSESARRHIAAGFQQAQDLKRPERITAVTINLLILIDGLHDLGLADLVMGMLKNENMVIRYWAVHCLTNTDIITQLNAATNSKQASAIAAQLKGIVDNSTPEIVALIAQFAAGLDIPENEKLLIQIADLRIRQYADWTVKYELYDSALLKYLSSKIPVPTESPAGLIPTTIETKPEIARRFAQLYSYAIQRYIKGAALLNDTQKSHLASVLVETEDKCLGRLLGSPQLTIRRALERQNAQGIMDEHDRLLGTATTPGQLPTILKFDYGSTSNSTRTVPIPLPDPPTKQPK
jgi:flagellin-specific chaperone FliS